MRPSFRSAVPALALAFSALVAAVAPAQAITGGEPDGGAHPSVAMIVGYDPDGNKARCTATLVSPTVLLTAGHCVAQTRGAMLVTFEEVVAERAPSGLPAAADAAAGYTTTELAAAGHLAGAPHLYPAYGWLADTTKNWNDVGAVVLTEPVTDRAPMGLAETGTLDRLAKPTQTGYTVIGYGVEVAKPAGGPQKAQQLEFPLIRRNAQVQGRNLSAQILTVGGNANDAFGTGGICDGDSGGPTLLDGELVAVTSYKLSEKCRSQSGMQRVDLAGVHTWLTSLTR